MTIITEALLIRDVQREDRPRERLMKHGAESLSNQELLALLLRTGSPQESVLSLAGRLLTKFNGLASLNDVTIQELTTVKGIGQAKAIQILSAIELGRRMSNTRFDQRFVFSSIADCANFFLHDMRFLRQENFVALYLNSKNQMIHQQTIFIGTINTSVVHPREIFREAIKRSAASIVVAHNHPSGDPRPSSEDLKVTERLASCGTIMGIDILDHIIIGENDYFSMRAHGYLPE